MADTMRTIAQLETILADNLTGAISAQDLRDAIIASIHPGYAEMSVTASAATTLDDTSTWVKVGGTWTLTDARPHWSMAVNGLLDFTEAADREVNVMAAVSFTVVGNGQQCQFAIAKNGTIISQSIIQRYVGTGADVGAAAVVGHADISTGETISLMCRNITSAGDITAIFANLIVTDHAA